MKASEARELAKMQLSAKSENELEKVYDRINSAAKRGECDIFYYGRLSQEVKNELVKDGYTLGDITDPRDNRPTYKIEW